MKLPKSIFDSLISEAKKSAPIEACGYLAGNDDSITKHYPLKNVDNSPEHFSFDPSDQFSVIKDVRASGLKVIGVYHSHPASPARPSVEDIKLAFDPNILYVIVSLSGDPDIKAYRIVGGKVTQELLAD